MKCSSHIIHFSAVISSTGMSFIQITETNYVTLSNQTTVEYTISVSTMPFNSQRNTSVVMYFSFPNFRVTVRRSRFYSALHFRINLDKVWTQFVALDWITTVGIVSGLTGFSRAIYYVMFAILDKIHAQIEKNKEEEKEEEKRLLEEPVNTIN